MRTGYCGVLRGYNGRARRSAGAPLRVALRYGTPWRRTGHVWSGPAAELPWRWRPETGHAGLPGAQGWREAPFGPMLRRETIAEPRAGALPHAGHRRRWLRFPPAQEVSAVERQED